MTFNPIRAVFLVCLFAFLQVGCQKDEEKIAVSKPTTEYSAKLAQAWMVESYNTVKRQGLFALDASRVYAYTAIAMYESMVHGIPNGRSLEGQLQGLENLP